MSTEAVQYASIFYELAESYLQNEMNIKVTSFFENETKQDETVVNQEDLRMSQEELDLLDWTFPVVEPTIFELYGRGAPMTKKQKAKKYRYIPYRRLGHFREHLNRINYFQFITIHKDCFECVDKWVSNLLALPYHKNKTMHDIFHDPNIYVQLRGLLSKEHGSKFIEHIPYLIHYYRRRSDKGRAIYHNPFKTEIESADYKRLCKMFLNLEKQYNDHQIAEKLGRKQRFLSIYLVLQCLMTLCHIHPSFTLPVMKAKHRKHYYYNVVFQLLKKSEEWKSYVDLFQKRSENCTHCLSEIEEGTLDDDCYEVCITTIQNTEGIEPIWKHPLQ